MFFQQLRRKEAAGFIAGFVIGAATGRSTIYEALTTGNYSFRALLLIMITSQVSPSCLLGTSLGLLIGSGVELGNAMRSRPTP